MWLRKGKNGYRKPAGQFKLKCPPRKQTRFLWEMRHGEKWQLAWSHSAHAGVWGLGKFKQEASCPVSAEEILPWAVSLDSMLKCFYWP